MKEKRIKKKGITRDLYTTFHLYGYVLPVAISDDNNDEILKTFYSKSFFDR